MRRIEWIAAQARLARDGSRRDLDRAASVLYVGSRTFGKPIKGGSIGTLGAPGEC